jgi:hypothetical protein
MGLNPGALRLENSRSVVVYLKNLRFLGFLLFMVTDGIWPLSSGTYALPMVANFPGQFTPFFVSLFPSYLKVKQSCL